MDQTLGFLHFLAGLDASHEVIVQACKLVGSLPQCQQGCLDALGLITCKACSVHGLMALKGMGAEEYEGTAPAAFIDCHIHQNLSELSDTVELPRVG